jgi:hypothetical protein
MNQIRQKIEYRGENMGEIILLDKTKADVLLSLGFRYKERKIDNKNAYVFLQTQELMKELGRHYDSSSFLVQKNVCF